MNTPILEEFGVTVPGVTYRLVPSGCAVELAAHGTGEAVWSGRGNDAYGFPFGSLLDPDDLDHLLDTYGGFDVVQTFTPEFSARLVDVAGAAVQGGAVAEDRSARLWLGALLGDHGLASVIPVLDWPPFLGGSPHWDHARYVSGAFIHPAWACVPDADAPDVLHRHTVVAGIIVCSGEACTRGGAP